MLPRCKFEPLILLRAKRLNHCATDGAQLYGYVGGVSKKASCTILWVCHISITVYLCVYLSVGKLDLFPNDFYAAK